MRPEIRKALKDKIEKLDRDKANSLLFILIEQLYQTDYVHMCFENENGENGLKVYLEESNVDWEESGGDLFDEEE